MLSKKLLSLAEDDPNVVVSDLANFSESYTGSYSSFDDPVIEFSEISKIREDVMIGADMNFSIGGDHDLRDSRRTSRPSQLERERNVLRNDPYRRSSNKSGDTEVYATDRIPLVTYRRMANDATIGLGMDLLAGLVASLKYTVKLPDKEETRFLRAMYDRHHNYLVSEMVRKGRQNGFCFGQKRWFRRVIAVDYMDGEERKTSRKSMIDLREVKMINPEGNVRYYVGKDEKIKYVEQDQTNGRIRVGRHMLFWFTHGSNFGSPFGVSTFKRAYPYWHYYKVIFQYALRHLEKVGSPHLEGRYPEGNSTVGAGSSRRRVPNKKVILKMVEAIKSTGGVAMPNERDEKGNYLWSLEYKYPDSNSAANYIEILSYLDDKKLQSNSIPDAVLRSKSNYSETDAKVEILMVNIEDFLNQAETTLRQDILEPMVSYNFGVEKIDMLEFGFDRGALGRRKMLKELLTQYLRVADNQEGLAIDTWIDFKSVLNELGAPTLTRDELFIKDEASKSKDLVAEAQKQEDDNNREVNRVNPSPRPKERSADRKQVGE